MRLLHSCALGRPWAFNEAVVEWTDTRTGGRWVRHLPERSLLQPPTKGGMVTVSPWGRSMGAGKYTHPVQRRARGRAGLRGSCYYNYGLEPHTCALAPVTAAEGWGRACSGLSGQRWPGDQTVDGAAGGGRKGGERDPRWRRAEPSSLCTPGAPHSCPSPCCSAPEPSRPSLL